MSGGIYFGKRAFLSLAFSLAIVAGASGSGSVAIGATLAPLAPSELKVELNGTTDRTKAAESLSIRRDHVKELLSTLSQSNRIKPEESASFATQLDTLSLKLDNSGAVAIPNLVDEAEELDSLLHRIAKAANLNSFPNVISVDSFGQDREFIADVQKNDEQCDIICLRPSELRMMLNDRRQVLDAASTKEDSDSPRADIRLSNELARLEHLKNGLDTLVSDDNLLIPVVVEHDLLGNRVLGIVRTYELRPMVDANQPSTPTASLSTFSEDLSDQISQLETRLQREVLTERITSEEASRVGEGLKTIVSLEKEYRIDGQLSETELARLSSALFRLNSRLNRSVAVK